MKKYKLLKDLPWLEAGTIIEIDKMKIKNMNWELLEERDEYKYYIELDWDRDKDWLEEIKEPKSIYKLKEWDEYYFIVYNLWEVRKAEYKGDSFDYNNIIYWNAFLTKQEAEQELKKRKAMSRIKKWIWENEVWTLNWYYVIRKDYNIEWEPYLDVNNTWLTYWQWYHFYEIVFQEKIDAERCLEECKNEWNILFDLEE